MMDIRHVLPMTALRNTLLGAVALLVFGLTFTACDFLEREPRGSLSEPVLANLNGAQTLLTGAYAALDQTSDAGALVSGGPWEASPDNWIYGSVAAGIAHKGSDAGDQPPINVIARGDSDPTIGFFDSKWRALYEGISRANSVLALLPQVEDATEAELNGLAAEARFLRGHYYFELKKMFNNIPWIDETTEEFKQPNTGADAVDVWPRIEEDFTFAMNNLPETQPEVGRVNSWAAMAYLAKTHVYQQDFTAAKPLFDDVIANGQTSNGLAYDLTDMYEANFRASMENNEESVFAIQMVGEDGTGLIRNSNAGLMLNFPYNSPFRCCGFFQPTQDLVNSFKTDANGLPLPDTYNQTDVTNDFGVGSDESYTPYAGEVDPRLDWTVGRRGVAYHDWGPHPGQRWIRDQNFSGPYAPKKNVYWQATQDQFANNNEWAPGTAINYPVIRFADVLLLSAETEAELGNLDAARQLVNRVRARAANPDGFVDNDLNREFAAAIVNSETEMTNLEGLNAGDWVVREDRGSTFVLLTGNASDINNWQEYTDPTYNVSEYSAAQWPSSQDEALDLIFHERKLELAMEGHRYFDLVRSGRAEQTLNALYDFEGSKFGGNNVFSGGQFQTPKNLYFPIPQRQIDLSTVDGVPTLEQNPGY